MKQPYYNELRTLLPHIQENFLAGLQQYRDQLFSVRFEQEALKDLYAGLIKHHGGIRVGYMRKGQQSRQPNHRDNERGS